MPLLHATFRKNIRDYRRKYRNQQSCSTGPRALYARRSCIRYTYIPTKCSICAIHFPHSAHIVSILGTDSSNPRRNVPPKRRTHADTVAIGEYLLYTGERVRLSSARMEEVQKNTGVNGYCIFALVHCFDIILDFTLDWMHINKGIWDGNLLPLTLGKGRPTKPTPNQILPNTILEPTRMGIARRKNRERLDRYNKNHEVQFTMPISCPFSAHCVPITCPLCISCRIPLNGPCRMLQKKL